MLRSGEIQLVSDPTLNNCLLERVDTTIYLSDGSSSSIQNDLFLGGAFNYTLPNGSATVQNNLFDQTTIPDNSGDSEAYVGGYNAHVTGFDQLQPSTNGDLALPNSPSYQVGPLGRYYQPTNSLLINAGSANADTLGLYDYTVTTNFVNGKQIKETNSLVDIGYHYVAVDTNGIPLSTYGYGWGCKTLSVNCLPSIRFAPSGVRRSEGERSEPSAAEPRRGQSGSAREKLVEGGPYWFPVGVSRNTTNINTTWPTNTSLNS